MFDFDKMFDVRTIVPTTCYYYLPFSDRDNGPGKKNRAKKGLRENFVLNEFNRIYNTDCPENQYVICTLFKRGLYFIIIFGFIFTEQAYI